MMSCPYLKGRVSADTTITIFRRSASWISRTSLSRSLKTVFKRQHLIAGCLYTLWRACCHCSSTFMEYTLRRRKLLLVTWGTTIRIVGKIVQRLTLPELEQSNPKPNTATKSDADIGRQDSGCAVGRHLPSWPCGDVWPRHS